MKIGELTISRTQILDYLNCGYRWDLSYRRGITSVRVREAVDLGSAVHRAIKSAIRTYVETRVARPSLYTIAAKEGVRKWALEETKTRGALITDEIKTQIKTLRDEAVTIAVRALEHFDLAAWEVARWQNKPLFERELIAPLLPWRGYRVIPDLVAREKAAPKSAGWWLVDWKTRGSFESDDAEEINLQFATIQYVMRALGIPLNIEGSILWQIRSLAPKWPAQNKDGSMSRALIATDWETYKSALIAARLDPRDYKTEMQPKLAQIEWFRTIRQHRSDAECAAVWREIVVPAADRMARDPQVIRRWVHQPFGCSGCWARQFCLTELRDEDTEFLLETDYLDTRRPRKRRKMDTQFDMV